MSQRSFRGESKSKRRLLKIRTWPACEMSFRRDCTIESSSTSNELACQPGEKDSGRTGKVGKERTVGIRAAVSLSRDRISEARAFAVSMMSLQTAGPHAAELRTPSRASKSD